MDVMRSVMSTPPPRSPIRFFGESHFAWAPKKPCRPTVPKKSIRGEKSARTCLNFSAIPIAEEKDENMFGLQLTRSEDSIGERVFSQERTRLQTASEGNLHTPNRPNGPTSLLAGRSTARRIDFAVLALGQDEPKYTRGLTGNGGLLSQMGNPTKKRQAVEEFASIGNGKSKQLSSFKKARLTRLMR